MIRQGKDFAAMAPDQLRRDLVDKYIIGGMLARGPGGRSTKCVEPGWGMAWVGRVTAVNGTLIQYDNRSDAVAPHDLDFVCDTLGEIESLMRHHTATVKAMSRINAEFAGGVERLMDLSLLGPRPGPKPDDTGEDAEAPTP